MNTANLIGSGNGTPLERKSTLPDSSLNDDPSHGFTTSLETLTDAHYQNYYAPRAVSRVRATERGAISMSATRARALGAPRRKVTSDCIGIPTRDKHRSIVAWQFRPDVPVTDGRTGKAAKYVFPADHRSRIDVTPCTREKWGDPHVPKIITESPTKSDSLASGDPAGGWLTVCYGAMYGSAGWKGSNDQGAAGVITPDLEDLPCRDRDGNPATIYLAPDANVQSNVGVWLVVTRLKRWLESHGAKVLIVCLPLPDDPSVNVGPDDWRALNPKAPLSEFLALARETVPQPPDPESGQTIATSFAALKPVMDAKYGYIRDDAMVVALDNQKAYSLHDFEKGEARDQRYYAAEGAKGALTIKQGASEWLAQPDKTTFSRRTAAPGYPLRTERNECNRYAAFPPWGLTTADRDPDVVKLYEEIHYEALKQATDDEVRHVMQFEGHPWRNPRENKVLHAVTLISNIGGMAKDTLGTIQGQAYELFGGEVAWGVGNDILHGRFTNWLKNKLFVQGMEISGLDKRADRNKLKAIITEPVLEMEGKGIDSARYPNTANFWLTSNEAVPVNIPRGERRYYALRLGDTRPPAALLDKVYSQIIGNPHGLRAVVYFWIFEMDYTGFSRTAPIDSTSGMDGITYGGNSDLERLVEDLVLNDPVLATSDIWRHAELVQFNRLLANEGGQLKSAALHAFSQRPGYREWNAKDVWGSKQVRLCAIRKGDEWNSKVPRDPTIAAEYRRHIDPHDTFQRTGVVPPWSYNIAKANVTLAESERLKAEGHESEAAVLADLAAEERRGGAGQKF